MKKNILIVAYSLEIGGIERSLISLLDNFDYDKYEVDLMLYNPSGELFHLLNPKVNLLTNEKKFGTFGIPIVNVLRKGHVFMALGRLLANLLARTISKLYNFNESCYYQVQLMYKFTHPFLKKNKKHYDFAIGYIWPHDYVIDKVNAATKIGWIHTDYSNININNKLDLKSWNKLDYIVSISDNCTESFLKVYPELESKIVLIENIMSPQYVMRMADESRDVFDKNSFNILSIGRLCHPKGFDIAVSLMKKLHDRGHKDIKWYIIGEGPDREKIESLIQQFGLSEYFILLGKKVNPYPYLKECDLYIQPSRYEGKAVTIGEAKILHKPILIPNYETAASQLINEFDGIIVNQDEESLVEGILRIYSDQCLRNKLSKNCSQIKYDNAHEILKLYNLIESEGGV